jgi:hypothetical protein
MNVLEVHTMLCGAEWYINQDILIMRGMAVIWRCAQTVKYGVSTIKSHRGDRSLYNNPHLGFRMTSEDGGRRIQLASESCHCRLLGESERSTVVLAGFPAMIVPKVFALLLFFACGSM